MTRELQRRWPIILLAVLFEGGLGLLAFLLGWLIGYPPWEHVRWQAEGAALGIAASVPMLVGFFVCVRWPVGPLVRIKDFADDIIVPLFAPCSLLELAFISLLAGVGEEALFRGVLQD